MTNRPYQELSRESIIEARKLLMKLYKVYVDKPQLLELEYISDHFKKTEGKDTKIHFLRTDELKIRSYKARGAATVIMNALDEVLRHNAEIKAGEKEGELIKDIKIIADSEGNHAQGVATSVSTWNKLFKRKNFLEIVKNLYGETEIPSVTAEIFMSTNASKTKVERTEKFGGKYVTVPLAQGKAYDVARAAAVKRVEELQESSGDNTRIVYCPPFNSQFTAQGAGTYGVDIDTKLGKVAQGVKPDAVIMGLGGGGLSAGLARYYEGTDTKVVPVGTALHPAVIAGLVYGGNEIDVRNIDANPSKVEVGGATISKGGKVTLDLLLDSKLRMESAHPEQLAWLLNEYITKELKYKSFGAYRSAVESGAEKRKVPELAGLQSLAYLRNHPEFLDGKKNVVVVVTGGNIGLHEAQEYIHETLEVQDHKEYPKHLQTPFYDPKDLVGSLESLVGIVDDRKEVDRLKKEGLKSDDVQFTEKLTNILYALTDKVIERIGTEVPREKLIIEATKLVRLMDKWAVEGKFNQEEHETLINKIHGRGVAIEAVSQEVVKLTGMQGDADCAGKLETVASEIFAKYAEYGVVDKRQVLRYITDLDEQHTPQALKVRLKQSFNTVFSAVENEIAKKSPATPSAA